MMGVDEEMNTTIGTDDDDIVPVPIAPMPPRLNALIHFPTPGEYVEVEIFGAALKWSTVADHASEKYRALYDDDTKTIVRLFRISTRHNGVAEYPVWSTHLPEECDNVPFADLTFAPTGTDVTVLDLRAELHDDGDDEATDDNGGRRRRKRNRQRSKSRDQTAVAAAPASPPRRQEKKQKTNASAPALPAPLALPAPPPAPTPAQGTKMAQPTPEKLGDSTGGGHGHASYEGQGSGGERQERDARERDARARFQFYDGFPPPSTVHPFPPPPSPPSVVHDQPVSALARAMHGTVTTSPRRSRMVRDSTATLEDVVTTYRYIDPADGPARSALDAPAAVNMMKRVFVGLAP